MGVGTTVDVPVGGGGICVGEGVACVWGVEVLRLATGLVFQSAWARCFDRGGQRGGGWQRPAAGDEGNRQGEGDDKEQRRPLRVSTPRLVSYRFVASTNYMHTATLLSGGPVVKGGGGWPVPYSPVRPYTSM